MNDHEKEDLYKTLTGTSFSSVSKISNKESQLQLSFKELVDIPRLQELTDELYKATGIPSAIISIDGEVITGSGWQQICTDFHREHPHIEKECMESDIRIRQHLDEGEPFVIYRCPRGLVDASSPVIIDNEHVANVFAGQLFSKSTRRGARRVFQATGAEVRPR